MSNSNKIILAILSFVICAFIGYMGMTVLTRAREKASGSAKPSAQNYSAGGGGMPASGGNVKPASGGNAKPAQIPENIGNVGNVAGVSQQQPSAKVTEAPKSAKKKSGTLGAGLPAVLEILSVTSPEYDEASKTYSFEVVASGENITYTLADSKKRDVQSNQTGEFKVQPTASGKYYVYVSDAGGNKTDYQEVRGCYKPVNKVTKEELQTILNSGKSQEAIDADFPNRVSSGCRYEFVGISEDETPPGSYNEIINRIRMRTWSSVTVLSVLHNKESNKLVRAKIQVNY